MNQPNTQQILDNLKTIQVSDGDKQKINDAIGLIEKLCLWNSQISKKASNLEHRTRIYKRRAHEAERFEEFVGEFFFHALHSFSEIRQVEKNNLIEALR